MSKTHQDRRRGAHRAHPLSRPAHFLRNRALPALLLCSLSTAAAAWQTPQDEADPMAALAFMRGDWKGTSTSFGPTGPRMEPISETIGYRLDGNLLVLEVDSPSLRLHTLIHYDAREHAYVYTPFGADGGGTAYRAELEDGRLRVQLGDTRRLTFEPMPDGRLREYGQQLEDGTWTAYFEDLLSPVPAPHTTDTANLGPAREYIGARTAYTDVVAVTHQGIRTLYVAGQVGRGDGMAEQFESAYRAVEQRLAEAGADFTDIVKMTIYIAGYDPRRDLQTFFDVRQRLYGDMKMPANVFVGVDSLFSEEHKVEMDAIAITAAAESADDTRAHPR